MKDIKCLPTLFACFCMIAMLSCDKNEIIEIDSPLQKRIAKIEIGGYNNQVDEADSTPKINVDLIYNDSLLTFININNDSYSTKEYIYEGNKISEKRYNGAIPITYFVDDGLVAYDSDDYYYEYNSNKQLEKMFYDPSGTDMEFTYKNGNLEKFSGSNSNTITYISSEYDNKSNLLIDWAGYSFEKTALGCFGNGPSKLIKESVNLDSGDHKVYEYKFDDDGYVTEITEKMNDDSYINIYKIYYEEY